MSGRSLGILIAAVVLSTFVYVTLYIWEDFRIDQATINNLHKACLPSRQEQVHHLGAQLIKPNRMKLPTFIQEKKLYCFTNVLMFRTMPDMSGLYIDKKDPLYRGGYPRSVVTRLVVPKERKIEFFQEHPPEISKAEVEHVFWSTLWIDNDTWNDCQIELLWYYHNGTMNSFFAVLPALTLKEFRLPYGTVYLKTRGGEGKSNSVAIQMLKPPTENEKSTEYCAFLFNLTGQGRYKLDRL